MASDTLKVLGQVNPPATTLTTLYTVPGSSSTSVSSVVVCNQSTAATFRISIQVAAAADNAKQYIYYDTPIGANDTFVATIGITLATTDIVKVYSSSANLSFSIFGVEVG